MFINGFKHRIYSRRNFSWVVRLITILLTAGLLQLSAWSKPVNEKNAIVGRITDESGDPLEGVRISLLQLDKQTTTDKEGNYRIGGLPPGTYTVVFQTTGYAPETREVTFVAEEVASLDMVMKSSVIELQPIIVTGAPKAADPLTTSADIDVLAGREKAIQETSALGESLDRLPGVTSIATGSQVGKPVIRGLSSNRIRVLTDGMSMDYQQYGVRHWANVDPYTADRIEVVRGASSVLYGSDALGGAVNVIPKRIPDALDMPSFFQGKILSQYLTNNNEALGGLQLEGAVGSLGITGLLVRRSGGNIHVPEEKTSEETGIGTDPKFTGELDFTDFDQLNGSLGVGYSYGPGRIGVNYFHWGNEHNFLLPNGKGIGQKLENDIVQVKGILPFGGIWVAKPIFSYMENLRLSNKDGSSRDRLPDDIVIDLLLKTYAGRLEIEHSGMDILSGKLGLEYMYQDQDTRGAVPLSPSAIIGNFALFAFEEAKLLDNIFLSLGARFDRRTQEAEANKILELPDYEAGETDDVLEQSYNAFSGSIGAVYRFTEELALAANIGRGFRAPSVFELHVNSEHGGIAAFQIGDPELEEEISLNSDLSIRWRSPVMQAKVTAYRNAIDNYIYLANTEEMFVKPDDSQIPIMRATQGDAELIGLDTSAQIQILPWLQLRGLFETVNGENIDTDEKLPLLPATKMEGEVMFNHRKLGMLRNLYLSFGVRYSTEKEAAGRFEPFWQFDANPNFGVASTDAYTLFDLGLGFDIPLIGKQICFDLAAKNILNKAYRDFLDTYKGYALSPGRNLIFKLSIPFGFSTK